MSQFIPQLIHRNQLVQTLRQMANDVEAGTCPEAMIDFSFIDNNIPEVMRPDSSLARGIWKVVDDEGNISCNRIGTMEK